MRTLEEIADGLALRLWFRRKKYARDLILAALREARDGSPLALGRLDPGVPGPALPANNVRLRCWRCRREFVSSTPDTSEASCPACQTKTVGYAGERPAAEPEPKP